MTETTETTETMTTTDSVDVERAEAVEEVKKEPKQVRIVDMEDGTRVNFGVRANTLSNIDVETSTVTFKIVTGKVINWVFSGLESLSALHKTMVLYAGAEKVKSALTGMKEPEKIVEEIEKQIAKISAGEFPIRVLGESSGDVKLDNWQKAFAMAVAYQPGTPYPHWTNVDDATVITEVLNIWAGKTAQEKNKVRRHEKVLMYKAQFDAAEGLVPELL